MDCCLIVAVYVFPVFVGVASVCSNLVTNIDNYYCIENNITCSQCTEHTFYNGTCKIEYGPSYCPPCPPGTENTKPHHLDIQCQEKKLDADSATDSKCIEFQVIEDWFFCLDTRFICRMCEKNTRYIGPCTENNRPAKCVPCEPGTGNPSDFHMDKDCIPIPSNISNNPDGDAVIQSPEDFRRPQDRQRENQPPDSSQGIRLSMNPLVCFLLLFVTIFFFIT